MKGESTFYVELSETSAILKHATPYSLVLVDELGRGTATFDGTAIAESVVKALADRECLTIFSTHYHSLVEDLASSPRIAPSHMMPANTLLKYFAVKSGEKKPGAAAAAATMPKREEKTKSPPNSTTKSAKKTPSSKNAGNVEKKKTESTPGGKPQYKVGDVVWGRVDGHPWWPAMVIPHPTTKKHFKDGNVHLQFFEEKPTRAWVKLSQRTVQIYTGSKSGPVSSVPDPAWKKATLDANDALTTPVAQRLNLIVDFPPSDEEMEADDDDDDEEDGDVDSDQSKENVEILETATKKRKKSPKREAGSASPSPVAKRPRRRIIESDDEDDGDMKADEDSTDEFKPPKSDDESESEASSGTPEHVSEPEPEETEVEETPPKKAKRGSSKAAPAKSTDSTPKNWLSTFSAGKSTPASQSRAPTSASKLTASASSTKKRLSMFAADDGEDVAATPGEAGGGEEAWEHLKVAFLKPENIKDGNGRRPTDPDYDPRTLLVPKVYLDGLTPGMRQWWIFKAQHYDVVLFFKVGKFYELYHMDAVTGVNELNLLYMRGKFAHSGFPEISYGRFADRLITKGYKVARIEQTETPDQNKERCAKLGRSVQKWDKVVRRELCRVTTPATRFCSVQDENVGAAQPKYLLAISTKVCDGPGENMDVGVAFVDTTVGRFHVGQFTDDRCCSRLRTLMAHFVPATILLERGKVSVALNEILKNIFATKEALAPGTEFMDAKKTLKTLSERNYFVPNDSKDDKPIYPEALKELMEDGDGLALTPKSDKELCLRALGAVVWYLQDCLIDDDTISLGLFEEYQPVDWEAMQSLNASMHSQGDGHSVPQHIACGRHLVLDGITMRNLDLLVNSTTGLEAGTLIEQIDHCSTPFGKRLLRDWLCRPLCNVDAINARLDAVEVMRQHRGVITEAREKMRTLPDFQRLLPRVHSEGSGRRSQNHPDARAVLFEAQKYSKRRIEGFLRILDGFKSVVFIHDLLIDLGNSSSTLLQNIIKDTESGGRFPVLTPLLEFFDEAFDHQEARKNGNIIPARPGVDEQYDEARARLDANALLREEYLREQSAHFHAKVTYIGTGRNRFQLEVSDSAASRATNEHELSGQRKGYRRFHTPETKKFLLDEMKAEDAMENALQDIGRSVMAKFDSHFKAWSSAVDCLALIDVLVSLAVYADSLVNGAARPEFVVPKGDQKPFFEVVEGRHPCLGDKAVPNNIRIGDDKPGFVLLTGPNMGGKSTFMRQAGLTSVLAQIGCFVPAESCRLTPVDRIFTRIGASDSIMKGESTFYVELSETSAILKHATPYSLVLVDELGRGTATFDGTAIAESVVKALADRECLTIFSTHYHSLVEDLASSPRIALSHMACMVEHDANMDDNDAEDPTQETITFLYRNEPGPCPKSYGFNAARLAGLPDEVIRRGHRRAVEFEQCIADEAGTVMLYSVKSEKDFCGRFAELTCRG